MTQPSSPPHPVQILASPINQKMMDAYARANRPVRVQIDLTYRCDLDCQHCYLDNRATWPELTTAEWRQVLGQLAELGVWDVGWSGGEVSLRPDFVDLLTESAARGFMNSVRTHAGGITPELAAKMADAKVTIVRVSVYSLRPEVHDRFTRRPGSLAATLKGIQTLREAGLPVTADCTLQPETIEEVPTLVEYFKPLGVDVSFGTDIYRDHAARQDLDLLVLGDADRSRARALMYAALPNLTGGKKPVHERQDEGACAAGRSQFYISPDGAVWPCVMFPMELGHLREHRLVDIWENSPQLQGLQKWKNKDRDGCLTCAGSGMCFYCPGEAYKTTGDYKTPPAHFHTRTRAELRGYEQARGAKLTAEEWATIPDGGSHPPRPNKFIFPIYRPKKGRGVRVGDAK